MNFQKCVEEQMKRFPEGSNNHRFFKQLLRNLEPDGLSESVRKELNESQANLSESIQKYFKYHIVYTSALKALNSDELQQNVPTTDHAELFYLNILKKYVHNDTSCEKLMLFEECQPVLKKMLENKQKPELVELFAKFVEDVINEFCRKFTEYASSKNVNLLNWEKQFYGAITELLSRVPCLDSSDIKFNAVTPELQIALSTYFERLTEGIEILNKMVTLFQQKLDFQFKESDSVSNRSAYLKSKIRCLQLELQVSTYSKSAVKALNIIKDELDQKFKNSENVYNDLNNALEKYQILGPEYEELVEKFQLLTENIEKQTWTIQRLKAENTPKKE